MSETLWRRKIVRPIVALLRQGLRPEKLSFTIALGITLGVIPVLGSTVLLCALAAIAFRLNVAAIQLVNWLVYPFQLALLIPFYRIGGWMFKTPPSQLSVVHILALIRSNVFQAVANLWTVTVHALAAWLVLGSIATGLLYLVLVPVLCRMRDRFLPKTGEKSC
ncbi:MAG: DUF2062 domain-containing protein [Terracidiphilus sp.]|jgi:uncharacterized protein (DUF2062 family)